LAKRTIDGLGPDGLPGADTILEILKASTEALPTRDLARMFSLKGAQRTALRETLRELQDAGKIERVQGRRWRVTSELPPVAVLEVIAVNDDGNLKVRPVNTSSDGPPPQIEVRPPPRSMPAPGLGDRFVARLAPRGNNSYTATPLRATESKQESVVGRYRTSDDGGRIQPLERGHRGDFVVAAGENAPVEDGDLVAVEMLPARRLGLPQARIIENIGSGDAPGAISRIAIHRAGIPDSFPASVVEEAEAAKPPVLGKRIDLRDVPLVTIDGADARDFDDAVFAEPDESANNQGGWHLIVAIADVAEYVRPGSPLDREGFRRGNSAYFPDRVVPMLPEALSNGLCSLRPDEDRACLAADLWIGQDGKLQKFRFRRALMHSVARLTYEQVQAARDAGDDPVFSGHLHNLYGAYACLSAARSERGSLELELPERKIVLDDDGSVANIAQVSRFDSHKLIEEFMIAANVAAARELKRLRQPVMFRIHDEPSIEKLEDLRDMLAGFGVKLNRGKSMRPKDFNGILARVRGEAHERTVNEIILRSQMQAQYNPENLGHFGLGLQDYAHFTSPIRRYADLLVHRALIKGLKLGEGGLGDSEAGCFTEIGEHISKTERRAVSAERDANDRYTAAFLESRLGQSFSGTVRGATRSGLFIAIDDNGAEGFVPASRLPGGRPRFDTHTRVLKTEHGGAYRMGDVVEIRIAEADGLSGSAIFDLLDAGAPTRTREPRRHRKSGKKRADKRGNKRR
jgi:ribonuclease R